MTLIMGLLSSEFCNHASIAENYGYDNKIDVAEGHKLIAEAIHHTLKTLEVKRRTLVKVIPPASAAAAVTTSVADGAIKEVKEDDT
jgi:hypothetical protein